MKIMQKLLKDDKDTFLVHTTALMNERNPIVDRIMDGDSVDTVIMANKEGSPILTNMNLSISTRYATSMQRLGTMVHHLIMELDPFDEPLVFRLKSSKEEVMVAPHREFSIIVVQREKANKKPAPKVKK
ncbi:dynein light chain roadblock-type 1-like [Cydia pomonella]|uniref:dynein light chain roadblock-type 1-like n=1 Tax=Cydia pomonella TaxID=82600 RepID=UPI002ADE0D4D|nr:dynein light chain roadblock-type 1-like [Cydia pomonella]